MYDYLVSVLVISSLLGLITYLSYPGASERTTKFAVSVLLIYTVMTPILTFISEFSGADAQDILENIKGEIPDGDKEYISVSEEAIKSAIKKLIFSEYGIPEENIQVNVFGFDFERMRAEKINVILSGKGALSDYRSIERFVSELNIGVCEVMIEFG